MPLSEHEQRLLEQMERALYAEDPKFASSLRSAGPRPGNRRKAAIGVLTLLVDGVLLGEAQLVSGGGQGGALNGLTAGESVFFCTVPGHREAGMEGDLTVD